MKDFQIDETLGFLVNRTAIVMRQRLETEFKRRGYKITAEEWVLLNRLWQADGRTQKYLAESTVRDQTTVTRLVDRLEKKGLVKRVPDPADRRIVLARLTAKGRKLEGALIPIALSTVIARAGAGIARRDMATTLKTLRRVLDNLLEE